MEMRKTNCAVCGTRRHELGADQTLLGSGDGATEGLFYSISDGIYFKLMMEAPPRDASFVTGGGGSESISAAARTSKGRAPSKAGMNTWCIDWLLAPEIKGKIGAMAGSWTMMMIRRPLPARGFTAPELHPIRVAHKLSSKEHFLKSVGLFPVYANLSWQKTSSVSFFFVTPNSS